MRITPWVSSVLLAVAVCTTPAMAAEADAQVVQKSAAVKPQKSSDAAASLGGKDGCPVHEMGRKDAMHKAGEPCPMMQNMGKMHEGCDVRDKKDCMEKHGEPCQLQHDKKHMGKQHEACATLKDKPRSAN